jgi:hypothetical protein
MGVVCLMFDLIIRLFEGPLLSPSLGRVFGELRLLSGFLSLLGLWHGEESWPMIILLREGLRWSTGVVTCMCRCSGETVAHLLLYCDVSYVLWSKSLGVFGVQWVIPTTVADLLFGWWNWLGKDSSNIWNVVPLCLMWTLWWEQNRRTFEDKERSIDELASNFFRMLLDWSRVWGFLQSTSILEFIPSLHTCA